MRGEEVSGLWIYGQGYGNTEAAASAHSTRRAEESVPELNLD